MLRAPGSLWIDRFIRGNYSSDTNAIVVYVFNEAAQVYAVLLSKNIYILLKHLRVNAYY